MADIHSGGTVHGTGPEPSADANSGRDEHLPTTKLPPLPAPPPILRRSGAPPPGGVTSSAPPAAQALDATVPAIAPPLGGSPSFWRDVASAVSRRGEGVTRGPDVSVLERSVGAVCGGFGLALFFLALGVGLRSSPPEVASQPVVVAATVIARAAIACGMLGFGFGLLRVGERLLAGRGWTSNRPPESTARDARPPGLGG
jgi:hypothetical protein